MGVKGISEGFSHPSASEGVVFASELGFPVYNSCFKETAEKEMRLSVNDITPFVMSSGEWETHANRARCVFSNAVKSLCGVVGVFPAFKLHQDTTIGEKPPSSWL